MVKGDQFKCDWCTYSWKSKSELEPFKCPSCESKNIINDGEDYRNFLSKENIILFDKKKVNFEDKPNVDKSEIEQSFLSKVSKFFRKK